MKWYLAIPLSIALTLVVGSGIEVIGDSFGLLTIPLLAIWVAADSGSIAWGLLVFILFPLFLPWYLIRSGIKKREAERRAQILEPHKPE